MRITKKINKWCLQCRCLFVVTSLSVGALSIYLSLTIVALKVLSNKYR